MNRYKLQTAVLVLLSFTLGCSKFIIVGICWIFQNRCMYLFPGSETWSLLLRWCTLFITLLLGSFNYYRTMLVLTVIFVAGNILAFLSVSYPLLFVSRILTVTGQDF